MATEKRETTIVVKCQCEGYALDLTATLYVDQIPCLMAKLNHAGVTPAHSPYLMTTSAATNGAGGQRAPLCPIHGSRMKPSTKGGGWFCPRKLESGDYCKEQVS